MKFNLEIPARRLSREEPPSEEQHPAPSPPSDIVIRINLPPGASAVIPDWFELASRGGASLLFRLPEKSTGLTFGQLYKAVREAGGTITAANV